MQEIDWNQLGFGYTPTNCHIRYQWKNGAWDQGTLEQEPYFKIHVAATALHYGQAGFEGLKAFRHDDGSVHVFRPRENARRLARTAERIMMASVPEELFLEAVCRVVEANRDFVPPSSSGGSLYIRPLLFGSGAEIGLGPAKEYTFIVLVTPVGNYYREGVKAIPALVSDEYDRSAPRGTGHVKVGGNYAASLMPGRKAREQGFPIVLYLDSREHRYIDEFGTSNFIAVTADRRYVTPLSSSVLPSITNMSLMTIASDEGYKVEQRQVDFSELKDFTEVGACGTAVVISPISRIVRGERSYEISDAPGFGPVLGSFYNRLRAIQYGQASDLWGWNHRV